MARRSKKARSEAAKRGWKTRRKRQVVASIWADPLQVIQGESTTVFWKTVYADKNEITIGQKKVGRKGQFDDSPEETTTYVIRAKGNWFRRGKKRFRTVTARSVTVEVEIPDVITRKDYKRKKGGERERVHIEVVSRGPLKEDLSNVRRATVGKKSYSRREDIEALRALLEDALK